MHITHLSADLRADVVLDAAGETAEGLAPRLLNWIGGIHDGQVVQIISRDDASVERVLAWCSTSGNRLLKTEREGREIVMWIVRAAVAGR